MNRWQIRARSAAIPVTLGIALTLWTARSYSIQSVVLVIASLALAGSSLWSCRCLFGARAAWIFLACGVTLGWIAEQTGSRFGWWFGQYTYTDVLGPRLGDVPIVIPLMWFGLCHIAFVMASLALWRQPVAHDNSGWQGGALTAVLSAMIVTAFDLGADPYFVFQLKAWIMEKTDGYWFGETVVGFAGWMVVGFAIVAAFQALARPRLAAVATARAAAIPIAVYAGFIVFQLLVSQPFELRVIALFAMGIPALVAAAACRQWVCQLRERAA